MMPKPQAQIGERQKCMACGKPPEGGHLIIAYSNGKPADIMCSFSCMALYVKQMHQGTPHGVSE